MNISGRVTCGDVFRTTTSPIELITINGTVFYNLTEIEMRIAVANSALDYYRSLLSYTSNDGALVWSADALWILFSSFLVFFMQAGFGMLEVGSVAAKNSKNILVKVRKKKEDYLRASVSLIIILTCSIHWAV